MKLSGPGALSTGNEKTATLISSNEKGLSIQLALSGDEDFPANWRTKLC